MLKRWLTSLLCPEIGEFWSQRDLRSLLGLGGDSSGASSLDWHPPSPSPLHCGLMEVDARLQEGEDWAGWKEGGGGECWHNILHLRHLRCCDTASFQILYVSTIVREVRQITGGSPQLF